jgi:hypothetical protein
MGVTKTLTESKGMWACWRAFSTLTGKAAAAVRVGKAHRNKMASGSLGLGVEGREGMPKSIARKGREGAF